MQNTTATERGSGFTAVVLMGGQGRRLASVVADRSKPMALVDGEPFVLRVLDQLAAAGCAKAILATGHHGAAAEAELGTEHAGMLLVASREAAPLGTAGAVRRALEHTADGAVLVCNGDSHVDADVGAFVRWAATRDGAAALLAVRVADASRYGAVAVASDGRVLGFREKGVSGPGAVSAGVLWLPRAALQGIPPGTAASLEHDVLPALVAAELHALVVDAPFLDIGVPEAYAAASAHFAACALRRARPRQGLLVVDRDGTLIEERHYLADPAGVRLLPGVVDGLRAFAARGYELAVVTNQSGIGRGKFGQAELAAVHAELLRQLAAAGVAVRGIWHCPHHPELGCACRKPEPALLEQALAALGYAPEQCLVVGDKACDVELGARLGTRTALVRTGYGAGTERDGLCAPDLVVDDFSQLAAAVAPAGPGPGGSA